eukprot:scaffold2523_cov193-Skeletonema_menzelii.AAC.8
MKDDPLGVGQSECDLWWCVLVWFGGRPEGKGLPIRALGPGSRCTCSSLWLKRLFSSCRRRGSSFHEDG